MNLGFAGGSPTTAGVAPTFLSSPGLHPVDRIRKRRLPAQLRLNANAFGNGLKIDTDGTVTIDLEDSSLLTLSSSGLLFDDDALYSQIEFINGILH